MNTLSQITEYLNNDPKVSAAWLFGSVQLEKPEKQVILILLFCYIPGLSNMSALI